MLCFYSILTPAISLFAIIITTIVAIFSIQKTAEKSRATHTHSEMLSSLITSIGIFRKTLILLGNVANGVIHKDCIHNEYTETGLERYWKNINDLASQYEQVAPKLQLLLPVELFSLNKSVLDSLNDSRKIVSNTNLDPYTPNINSTELLDKIRTVNDNYFKYIEKARSYLGTNSLKGIGKEKILISELYNTSGINKK